MGSRAYSRKPNGRFRRATLENTFGLTAPSCPSCYRLNPHAVNEPVPENCHACGAAMAAVAETEGTAASCLSCTAGNDGGGFPCDCPVACGARYCQHPAETKEN